MLWAGLRGLVALRRQPWSAPIFDHGGHAVGAIAVVDATERIFPRGLAKGLSAAVSEAARGVSRELGAPRWPYAAEA